MYEHSTTRMLQEAVLVTCSTDAKCVTDRQMDTSKDRQMNRQSDGQRNVPYDAKLDQENDILYKWNKTLMPWLFRIYSDISHQTLCDFCNRTEHKL